jgi:hypothetical protein
MLIFASQTFAHGAWTLTPKEPATLELALVGLGMLAIYAAVTDWRPGRTMVAKSAVVDSEVNRESDGIDATTTRQAA